MPEPVQFYKPGERGDEARIKKYLAWFAEMRKKSRK